MKFLVIIIAFLLFAGCSNQSTNSNIAKNENLNTATSPNPSPSSDPRPDSSTNSNTSVKSDSSEIEKAINNYIAKNHQGWKLKGISNGWSDCDSSDP